MGENGKFLLRVLVTGFLAVFLLGFGACGLFGTIGSFWMGPVTLLLGAVGMVIAYAAGKAIRQLWREPPPAADE
jgi:hypothetical protein